jgi:uncharacterized protein YggE
MRLAGLIAAAALALAGPARAQDVVISLAPGEVLLRVQGEGVYRSRPDLMAITAGVVTTGSTARAALAANSELANRLIEAVRASGIAARDVQTSNLTVDPQFEEGDRQRAEREDRQPRITGYIARNRLHLTLRDLRRAPDIVDALFAAGANEVRGPHFGHSDPAPALRAARRAAVEAAREEADTYAEALAMRIVRVLRVSERSSFSDEDEGTIIVTGSRIPATPLEPGEISTEATVWIDYAMAPR